MTTNAIAQLVLSALCFSLTGACAKGLLAAHSAHETVFLRSLLCTVLTLATMPRTWRMIAGQRTGLLLVRGLLGYLGFQLYVSSLERIPFPDAAALTYTSPIVTGLLAGWILAEPIRRRHLQALLLSSAGIVLILRPQLELEGLGGAMALGSSLASAFAFIVIRTLTRTEAPQTIVLWFPLVTLPIAGWCALPAFVWPRGGEWWLVLGLGVFSQLGQTTMTRALQLTGAGTVSNLSFLSLMFTSLWSILFFAEPPSLWVAAGSALVIAGLWTLGRPAAEVESVSP